MTTSSSDVPDAPKEDQQPRTRGGAAPEDRSKGLGNESGGPFDSSKKDTAGPKEGAQAGKTS